MQQSVGRTVIKVNWNSQYIGETENWLHIRMNRRHSDIQTKKLDKPVAAHFCQPDHSAEDLEVRGIEKIHENNTDRRRDTFEVGGWSVELGCETA